jgi:hypothetical protein
MHGLLAYTTALLAAVGPSLESLDGAEFMYEVPDSPKFTLFFAHGCSHSATDFWAATPSCPQCLGLPEEVRLTKAALRASAAVVAISSEDRAASRCWSFQVDGPRVRKVLSSFRERHDLSSLPLVALGASSGGAFVLQLASMVPMAAVISQIMAIPPSLLNEPMPPTLFVHMPRDQRTASYVHKNVKRIRSFSGGHAQHLEVHPQKPTAAFFTERIDRLSHDAAKMLHAALQRASLLDADGYLADDPRHTPWRDAIRSSGALSARLPGSATPGAPDSLRADESAVAEALNVAWAMHEIVSDHWPVMLNFLQDAMAGRLKANWSSSTKHVENTEL